jgi:hypothetical protein
MTEMSNEEIARFVMEQNITGTILHIKMLEN